MKDKTKHQIHNLIELFHIKKSLELLQYLSDDIYEIEYEYLKKFTNNTYDSDQKTIIFQTTLINAHKLINTEYANIIALEKIFNNQQTIELIYQIIQEYPLPIIKHNCDQKCDLFIIIKSNKGMIPLFIEIDDYNNYDKLTGNHNIPEVIASDITKDIFCILFNMPLVRITKKQFNITNVIMFIAENFNKKPIYMFYDNYFNNKKSYIQKPNNGITINLSNNNSDHNSESLKIYGYANKCVHN